MPWLTGPPGPLLSIACPDHLSVVAEPAMQVSDDTEFDPDIVVVRLDDVGGAKF